LIFPHHENEIAQSEACNGKEFSKYWMHNAFLNIDNRKMSKSLGNFFTVREISEKYDLQVLRFFMLSAHYRSPLNFSAELMEASKNGLERIVTAVSTLNRFLGQAEERERLLLEAAASEGVADAALAKGSLKAGEAAVLSEAKAYVKKFEDAMDDDFNTADAISAIFELVKFANIQASAERSAAFLKELKNLIVTLSDILGLIVEKEEEMLDTDIEQLIAERQAARKAKNFARADEIRDELLAKGIVLKDTREGVVWTRA
ncbi:MAG: class I tRNA ligase family protein, partial [Lachnospiraceae bacterium]|nr:class I tRNA ligase family protein [Lachnospiraceae bacterium]